MHAQQILFLSIPGTGALAVFSRLPVPQFVSMALAAQPERLAKIHRSATGKPQYIALLGVMAVQAPAVLCVMFENNSLMFIYDMRSAIYLVVWLVALRAGENALGKRRWSHSQ